MPENSDRKTYDELTAEGIESDFRGDRFAHALGQLANEVLGLRWDEKNRPTPVMGHHKWPRIIQMVVEARRMLDEDDEVDGDA